MAADITTAKRLMASRSLEAAQILGAGISRPCHAGRYNAAAAAVLSNRTLRLTPIERDLIVSFIEPEGEPGPRERMLRVRMNDDEWDALQVRAQAAGQTMSEYVRTLIAREHASARPAEGQEERE